MGLNAAGSLQLLTIVEPFDLHVGVVLRLQTALEVSSLAFENNVGSLKLGNKLGCNADLLLNEAHLLGGGGGLGCLQLLN